MPLPQATRRALPKAAHGMQLLGAASGSTGLQQITKDSDSGALVLSGLLGSPDLREF
jgi:hypothetical protein